MKGFKIIGLSIVIIFMVLSLMFIFTFSAINNTLLNRNFYSDFIKNTDAITVVYNIAREEIEESIKEEDFDDIEEAEQVKEIIGIIFDVLDEDFVADQATVIIDQIFDFIFEENKDILIVIDLTDKREVIKNEIIDHAINEGATEEEAEELATEIISELSIFDEEIVVDLGDSEELAFVSENFNFFRNLIFVVSIFTLLLLSGLLVLIVKGKESIKYLSIIYGVSSLVYVLFILTIMNAILPELLNQFDAPVNLVGPITYVLSRFINIPLIVILISILMFVFYKNFDKIIKQKKDV